MTTIMDIDSRIRELTHEDISSRPFLCDGSPLTCQVAEVGINPGSTAPFWKYWSVEKGCDKAAWLRDHREKHGRRMRTREALEVFITALKPLKCLELNLYDQQSKQESDLSKDKKSTSVFDYMLSVVKPKVLIVHGNTPTEHLQLLLEVNLTKDCFTQASYEGLTFDIYRAKKHFSRGVSYEYLRELACSIQEHLT